jgi:hypothetical protein
LKPLECEETSRNESEPATGHCTQIPRSNPCRVFAPAQISIVLPSRFFKAAQYREIPTSALDCGTFALWYVSGIVLRPELVGGRAIRILLSHGVGSWLSSTNILFPSELLALAYSKKGEALLEGFNFFNIQNASTMPDRVPLFGLQLADKQQLVSFLKDRGLEIG